MTEREVEMVRIVGSPEELVRGLEDALRGARSAGWSDLHWAYDTSLDQFVLRGTEPKVKA